MPGAVKTAREGGGTGLFWRPWRQDWNPRARLQFRTRLPPFCAAGVGVTEVRGIRHGPGLLLLLTPAPLISLLGRMAPGPSLLLPKSVGSLRSPDPGYLASPVGFTFEGHPSPTSLSSPYPDPRGLRGPLPLILRWPWADTSPPYRESPGTSPPPPELSRPSVSTRRPTRGLPIPVCPETQRQKQLGGGL